MATARQGADWNRTAHLLAMLYNANRDPEKTKAASPDDFNPYHEDAPREAAVTVNREEAILLFKTIADATKR